MIVVFMVIQLEYRFAGLEMMALEDAGLFELRENTIYRGQADILVFRQ
jgi:hypothetical protein